MSAITLKKSNTFAVLVAVACFIGATPAYAEKELDHGFDEMVEMCEMSGAIMIEESANGIYCSFSEGDDIECEKGEGCYTVTVIEERITKPIGKLNTVPATQRVAPSMIQSR